MSAINASTRVYRDALTLSAVGKRSLHRALCRAILSNASDLKADAQSLHADIATVEGQVRNQRTRNGDNDDRRIAA